jgi:two-component system LytT family response regulator
LKEVEELKPDVVFLDIEMPKINGFTFLKKLHPVSFEVIFTTAYSEYAIDALRISALDFLTKPIDPKELVAAVVRLKERLRNKSFQAGALNQQMQLFLQYQQSPLQPGKIALPVLAGLGFIEANDIIKIAGENVYSVFYLRDGKKMMVSLTLKEVELMLCRSNFFRVHKSYIVNLKYIARYVKGEGGVVILTDDSEVEISRRNKAEFLKKISS